MIDLTSLATFTDAYPSRVAQITHVGPNEPLFTVPRLAVLASSLPASGIQIVDGETGEPTEQDMPLALVIQGIAGMKANIILDAVEVDPAYKALVRRTSRPLVPLTRAAGSPINAVDASIHLTGPGARQAAATTNRPQIVLQCRGERNLELANSRAEEPADRPANEPNTLVLSEGQAVYLPAGTSYSAANTGAVSVSLILKLDSVAQPEERKSLFGHLMSWMPRLK